MARPRYEPSGSYTPIGPVRGRRNPNRQAQPPVNELMPATMPGVGGSMFEDPYTKMLEDLAKNRIASLSRPFEDNGFDDVVKLIQSRIGGLTSAGPVSFGGGNPLLGDFIAQGRKRIEELNADPFTADEEARLRTKAIGNVEELRAAGKRRVTEDAARRGLGETSGIIQEGYQTVDRDMDRNRTTAEADLAMYLTGERNNRRNQASQLAAQLAAAGEAEASRGLQAQIASANFGSQREGQIVQMASMLADLSAQRRGEMRANQNDILNIATMLSQLAPQRLALMMNVLNGTGGNDVSGLFNNTLNLSNSQQNQQNIRNQGQAQMMAGLGQLLGYLANQPRS